MRGIWVDVGPRRLLNNNCRSSNLEEGSSWCQPEYFPIWIQNSRNARRVFCNFRVLRRIHRVALFVVLIYRVLVRSKRDALTAVEIRPSGLLDWRSWTRHSFRVELNSVWQPHALIVPKHRTWYSRVLQVLLKVDGCDFFPCLVNIEAVLLIRLNQLIVSVWSEVASHPSLEASHIIFSIVR